MIGQNSRISYEDLDVSALTPEEQKRLRLLLAEANTRNIRVPVEAVRKDLAIFPKDENGYFIKEDGTNYRATKSHASFINSNARFVLFFGSRGAGKSAAGAQKAIRKIAEGKSGTIINPKFEDFKSSTWEEFKKWIPPSTVIPAHRYRLAPEWDAMRPFNITFINGAKVYCKGLKDPDSARGANVNWLWYDEGGSDIDGRGWRIAIASVRVGKDPQAWVTSTPNGIIHWMYDFFMDEEKIKEYQELQEFVDSDRSFVESFYGTMEENKENLDPTFYVSMRTAYGGWEREQEIEGHFVSKGGALGDSRWFTDKYVKEVPKDIVIQNRVRFWDLAASEKKVGTDPDKTVGTRFSWAKWEFNQRKDDKGSIVGNAITDNFPNHPIGEDAFFIENQVSGYWEWHDIKKHILETAQTDGYWVKIRIEEEPGSGGKNQVAELENFLDLACSESGQPNFNVKGERPDGDKVMRANIWFAEARKGQIYVVMAPWNQALMKMINGFPIITHDDEVDSVSGARIYCAPIRMWKRIAFLSI